LAGRVDSFGELQCYVVGVINDVSDRQNGGGALKAEIP